MAGGGDRPPSRHRPHHHLPPPQERGLPRAEGAQRCRTQLAGPLGRLGDRALERRPAQRPADAARAAGHGLQRQLRNSAALPQPAAGGAGRCGRQMLREPRGRGFSGNYATVLRSLTRRRAAQDDAAPPRRPQARPGPPLVAAPKRVLTPRTAAWAVLRGPERRSAEDRALLAELRGRSPGLDAAVALAEGFAALVRGRRPELLDPWLKAAQDGPVAGLRRFAKRLLADDGAVRAALTLGWSNGQTEGQINRLKMLKRQMFGRAGLDLIERRFLLAA